MFRRHDREQVLASPRAAIVATALWYTVLLSVAAKLARAADLALSADVVAPLVRVPLFLGEDLVIAAALGAGVALLGRLLASRPGSRLVIALLTPWGFLLGMSVMSYRLTGTGVTWQRLRGDEGATLSDLDLLSTSDLVLSLSVVSLALLALPVTHWLCRSSARLRIAAHPLAPAWVGAGGLLLVGLTAVFDVDSYGLDENPVALLVQSAFSDEDERVTDRSLAFDADEWREIHRPSRALAKAPVPPLRGARPKNVVIVLGEGIPYRYTSWGAAGKDSTPNLRRRAAREGLLFDRFYSSYHSSIQSIFTLVCSAYPPMYVREGNIVAQRPRIDCGELSEHLDKGGRSVGLFHGGRFAYYDKLSLLGDRGYDITLDAEHLDERYPKWATGKWGIDDRAVIEGTLDWIDTLEGGQPFGAVLIPITAHYPYSIPKDVEARFPGGGRSEKFASAVAFLDQTVEQLIQGLEQRGLYDDTLVVVLADHGEKVDPLVHKYGGYRQFFEQNLNVPLLLLNPRLFPAGSEPRVSHRSGGIVDLLPTILDVLQLPPDPRHFGQSLLSDDYEPRRIFFGSFSGRNTSVGFVEGDTKFNLRMKDLDPSLYDLAADPDEQTDLAPKDPERVSAYVQDTLAFYRANQLYFLTAPSLPESRSLHERILDDVQVAMVGEEGRPAPCTRAAETGAWSCPGLEGAVLRSQVSKVDKDKSRCIEVMIPPPPASLELTLNSPAKGIISGARLGIPNHARQGGPARIDLSIDGEAAGSAHYKNRKSKLKWLQFKTPERELKVRVSRSSDEGPAYACLLFSDEAWRVVTTPAGALDEELLLKRN